MSKNRKVVVMRGPSGSGKSTYIQQHLKEAHVCSADKFFIQEDGSYQFDKSRIGEAHKWCKKQFKKALKDAKPLVVLDNTNTQVWEFSPYVQMAKDFGYEVEFVRLDTPPGTAASRNVHGVPTEAVWRMAARMEALPEEWASKETIVSGTG